MLSLAGVSASQGTFYFEKEDYYFRGDKGEVIAGKDFWDTKDKIDHERFQKIVETRIENTGGALNGNDRIADNLTFSAPKSVSLIAALGNPEQRDQVIEAHREAVKAVMDYIESSKMFQARDERGNPTAARGMLAVRFDHFTNRNGDPQLHSHVLIANVAERVEDGKLVSAYLREIYTNKTALGAMYRLELASRLEKLGYETEWRKDGTFEIKGFTEEQLKAFSTRRAEIEDYLQDHGFEGGKASEIAALRTRDPKKDFDPYELRRDWEIRAKDAGIKQLPSPSPEQGKKKGVDLVDLKDREMIASGVVEKALWTAGFSMDHRLELALAKEMAAQGKTASISEIKALAQDSKEKVAENYGGLRTLDHDKMGRERFTFDNFLKAELKTRELGIRENQNALDAEKVEETLSRFNDRLEKEKGFRLSEDQINLAKAVASKDKDAAVIGRAGAGKTTLMKAIDEVYKDQGLDVLGIAPTGTAAKNLESETGIKSFTVHSLAFAKPEKFKNLRGGLIIVDEAGMLNSTQATLIQQLADQVGAKILWVGDPDQIKPVAFGDPMLRLAQEAQEKGSYFELSKIHRQRNTEYREAVEKAVFSPKDSLAKFKELGWVTEAKNKGEMVKAAVGEYVEKTLKGEDVLLVTERNSLADRLNREIRYYLKEEGAIAKEGLTASVRSTDGRPLGEKEFVQGDKVLFLRNDKKLGVTNGLTGIVKEVDAENNILAVETKDGKTVQVNLNKYDYLTHGYAITVHKSQGQTVDQVIYVSDTAKGNVTNQNLYYVAVSRGRDSASIYTTDLKEFERQISESATKKDILTWGLGRDLSKEELNDLRQSAASPSLWSVVDLRSYPTYAAKNDLRASMYSSAGRELWSRLSPWAKQDIATKIGDLRPETVKELSDKAPKAIEKAGDWHPKTVRMSKDGLFKYVNGECRPTILGHWKYGIARAHYYAALRNLDETAARIWGSFAGYDPSRINKDIGLSRAIQGKEDPTKWTFALKYGADTKGKALAFQAEREKDLGKATEAMFYDFNSGLNAVGNILMEKFIDFIKESAKEGALGFMEGVLGMEDHDPRIVIKIVPEDKIQDALSEMSEKAEEVGDRLTKAVLYSANKEELENEVQEVINDLTKEPDQDIPDSAKEILKENPKEVLAEDRERDLDLGQERDEIEKEKPADRHANLADFTRDVEGLRNIEKAADFSDISSPDFSEKQEERDWDQNQHDQSQEQEHEQGQEMELA